MHNQRSGRKRRHAETILDLRRQRGPDRFPGKEAYRLLGQRAFSLRADGKRSRNDGAMPPGATAATVDGMARETIATLIDGRRHERYRWTPVRRTSRPTKQGTRRPFGLPSGSEKRRQEVMRSLLDA